MRLLQRVFGKIDDRQLYVWSSLTCVGHVYGCPQIKNIGRSNRRSSRDPFKVREECIRACGDCLVFLPTVPRPTFEHTIPVDWTWVWADSTRTAHRPSCPNVVQIRPEKLRGTNDPDELKRACLRGCTACQTTLTISESVANDRGLIVYEQPKDAIDAIVTVYRRRETDSDPSRPFGDRYDHLRANNDELVTDKKQ